MANQYTKEYTLDNIKAPKDIWRRINRAIRENPERHQQSGWHTNNDPIYGAVDVDYNDMNQILSCDTMHCVAGWGAVLTPGGVQVEVKQHRAASDVFVAALDNAGRLEEVGGEDSLYRLFYTMSNEAAAARVAEYARQEARNEKNAKLRAKRRAARRAQ